MLIRCRSVPHLNTLPKSSTNQNRVLRQVVKKSSDNAVENIFGKQYLNKCTYTITSLWNYYMNTIDDMQNGMDFYGHCNEFDKITNMIK